MEANVLSSFWICGVGSSSGPGAHSTAMAGETRLFRGRNELVRLATCKPFLRSSAATAAATAVLRPRDCACALSQGTNLPTAGGCVFASAAAYTLIPLPGGPA